MFLLRDLPKDETLLDYSKRYPDVDPSAVQTYLFFLRVASDALAATEMNFARHGISQARFTVLALLNRNPGIGLNPAEIASRAGVTRATITGLLDGLEEEAFIRREESRLDRRRCNIWLTDKGREFLDAIMPDHFRRIGGIMSCLPEEERCRLNQLLEKIRQGVPAMSMPSPEPTGTVAGN
jgi:DNA-binding MarR family transcriptional regulator